MPTYDYRCPNGHQFDLFQRMSDEPGADCPECGAAAERHISGGAGLDHVIKEQVLAQNILGEIVFHFPPNRVDVVCPVLPVVELDEKSPPCIR